jgi:hypothetical protein
MESNNQPHGPIIEAFYTNFRGETNFRRIQVVRFYSSIPGSPEHSKYHPKDTHFLYCLDVERGEFRDFAMSGFAGWRELTPEEAKKPLKQKRARK